MGTQIQEDIIEIVEAARAGGAPFAELTYRAVCEARSLSKSEAVMLAGGAVAAIREAGIVLAKRR